MQLDPGLTRIDVAKSAANSFYSLKNPPVLSTAF
jgi:hypothetical protein